MKIKKYIFLLLIIVLTNSSFGQVNNDSVNLSYSDTLVDMKKYKSETKENVDINLLYNELKKINEEISKKEETNLPNLIPILVVILAGLLALFQVKANIISTARIDWTQNLRKHVSVFLSETMILNFNFREVLKLNEEGKKNEAKKLYDEQIEVVFKKVYETGNMISLFLNNKKETEQAELQQLLDDYLHTTTQENPSDQIEKLEILQKKIIEKTQTILKKAWEDAKTFKMRDIFKFGW